MSGVASRAERQRPALVLLAHGSRHPELTASLGRLVEAVAEQAARTDLAAPTDSADTLGDPLTVRAAYLDLAQPDLGALATELAAQGFRQLVCVPTLFTSAFHAQVDVPDSAKTAAAASGLELIVGDIIGTGDDVCDVLLEALEEQEQPVEELILFSVGSSSDSANQAVDDLARRMADRLQIPARAAFGTRAPRGVDVLAQRTAAGARPTVISLFVSPGLLLDPMRGAAEQAGVVMLAPLETRLAGVVLARYHAAVSAG